MYLELNHVDVRTRYRCRKFLKPGIGRFDIQVMTVVLTEIQCSKDNWRADDTVQSFLIECFRVSRVGGWGEFWSCVGDLRSLGLEARGAAGYAMRHSNNLDIRYDESGLPSNVSEHTTGRGLMP